MIIKTFNDIPYSIYLDTPLSGVVSSDNYIYEILLKEQNNICIYKVYNFFGKGIPASFYTIFMSNTHIDSFSDLIYKQKEKDYYFKERLKTTIANNAANRNDAFVKPKDIIWSTILENINKEKLAKDYSPLLINTINNKFIFGSDSDNYSCVISHKYFINRVNSFIMSNLCIKIYFCIVNLYRLSNQSPVFPILASISHDEDCEYLSCLMNGIGEYIENFKYLNINIKENISFIFELYIALSILIRDGFDIDLTDIEEDPYVLTVVNDNRNRLYIVDDKKYYITNQWRPCLNIIYRIKNLEDTDLKYIKKQPKNILKALGIKSNLDFSEILLSGNNNKYQPLNNYHIFYVMSDITPLKYYKTIATKNDNEIDKIIARINKNNIENTALYKLMLNDIENINSATSGDDDSSDDENYNLRRQQSQSAAEIDKNNITNLNMLEYENKIISLPLLKIFLLYTWNKQFSEIINEFTQRQKYYEKRL